MIREDLSVDQAVIVWDGVHKRVRRDGRVARIARKYVTIEVWYGPNITREVEFDIETQKERGPNSGYPYAAIFRTPEHQAREERKQAAEEGLRELGLITRPSSNRRLTLEEAEAIVAAVRGMREVQEDPGLPSGN